MERAVILADEPNLMVQSLPIEMQKQNPNQDSLQSSFDLSSVERQHIQKVLSYCKGNKTEAARLLNIGLTTLYRKIEESKIV